MKKTNIIKFLLVAKFMVFWQPWADAGGIQKSRIGFPNAGRHNMNSSKELKIYCNIGPKDPYVLKTPLMNFLISRSTPEEKDVQKKLLNRLPLNPQDLKTIRYSRRFENFKKLFEAPGVLDLSDGWDNLKAYTPYGSQRSFHLTLCGDSFFPCTQAELKHNISLKYPISAQGYEDFYREKMKNCRIKLDFDTLDSSGLNHYYWVKNLKCDNGVAQAQRGLLEGRVTLKDDGIVLSNGLHMTFFNGPAEHFNGSLWSGAQRDGNYNIHNTIRRTLGNQWIQLGEAKCSQV
jgi:hypothetical protein